MVEQVFSWRIVLSLEFYKETLAQIKESMWPRPWKWVWELQFPFWGSGQKIGMPCWIPEALLSWVMGVGTKSKIEITIFPVLYHHLSLLKSVTRVSLESVRCPNRECSLDSIYSAPLGGGGVSCQFSNKLGGTASCRWCEVSEKALVFCEAWWGLSRSGSLLLLFYRNSKAVGTASSEALSVFYFVSLPSRIPGREKIQGTDLAVHTISPPTRLYCWTSYISGSQSWQASLL